MTNNGFTNAGLRRRWTTELPLHLRYILRPPPMSTTPAKLSFHAVWAISIANDSRGNNKDQHEV